MNPIDLALIVSGLLALPFSLSVLLRNPKNPLNISFSVFTLHIMLWAFSIVFFRIANTTSSALFWDQMIYYCGSVVPASVFYFAYVLVNKRRLSNAWTAVLVSSSLLFIGILFLDTGAWIKQIILNNIGNSVILGPAYVFWMIYFAAVYISGLVIIYKKYLKTSGFDKSQLKFVFFASLMPIFIGIVPNVLLPLIGNYKLIYIGPFANLIMVLIISYAILKHRFMDIRLILARSISYGLLLLILATTYIGGLILVSSRLINVQTSTQNLAILTLMSLIMAYTFQPLRRLLEKTTDKIFFKDRYDTETLLNVLSKTMATSSTFEELTKETLKIINHNLRLIKSSYAILNDGVHIIENDVHEKHLILDRKDIESMKEEGGMLILDEMKSGSLKDFMRSHDIYLAVPLSTKEHFIGFLLLGGKSSGDMFFDQDINFLSILGPELSVALQNAQRFEEINKFNATLQEKVKKATNELETANAKLKKLDQVKDEFISIASHDLRSPMATVKNYIWLAKSEMKGASGKAKKDLDIALESTEHGISLVADMLDVSRIEAGRIELNPEKLDVKKELALIVEELGKAADDKQITLISDATGELFMKADKERIHQVLTNLTGNAIKFTPEKGKVTIAASKNEGMVQISITDTGIGIKKEDIGKLFTKFGKLENGTGEPSTPGTGLGLYISKNIIELSGGKIWVESHVGKGSVFTFTLPAA